MNKPMPIAPVTTEVNAPARIIVFNCINRKYGSQIQEIASEFGTCLLSSGNSLIDDRPVSYRLNVSDNYNFPSVYTYLKDAAAKLGEVAKPQPIADVTIEFELLHLVPNSRSIDIYCTTLEAWNRVSREFTCYGSINHFPSGPNHKHLRLEVSKIFDQHEVWKYLCTIFPQVPEKTKAK